MCMMKKKCAQYVSKYGMQCKVWNLVIHKLKWSIIYTFLSQQFFYYYLLFTFFFTKKEQKNCLEKANIFFFFSLSCKTGADRLLQSLAFWTLSWTTAVAFILLTDTGRVETKRFKRILFYMNNFCVLEKTN